jgi:4-hydroxy-4-methyl-2-oxoglutarate aldolase
VRDVAELRASDLPCYAAGIVPAGPHKGWGGAINGPVQVGGCIVLPGDIIVGDDDGIAVVPFDRRAELLADCGKRKSSEEAIIRRLEAGETTVEILGLAT